MYAYDTFMGSVCVQRVFRIGCVKLQDANFDVILTVHRR